MTLKDFLNNLSPICNIRLYDYQLNFLYEMTIEDVNYHGVTIKVFPRTALTKASKYFNYNISYISNYENGIEVIFYEF